VVVVKPNSAAVVTTISKLPPANMPNPAIVVLHYNRIAYLTQTLESLVRLPGIERFKVYLSQDGPHADAEKLAQRLRIEFINRPHDKLLDERQSGTAHLAQHYKWALDQLILPKFNRAHSHVIMVEDDMIFSPDFLHYFQLTAPLLDTDPTLWCVSSWNDLGVNRYVSDARRLFRTDFFSGLGWMLNAKIWQELSPIFPLDQWDWWMRGDVVSRGRDCIVPEVSRNKNIGEFGVNLQGGSFFEYLKSIAWNEATDTDFGDLSYLRRDHYDAHITDLISRAINTITPEHAARSVPPALPIVTSAPQITIVNQQFAPHAKLHGLNARPAIRKLLAAAMEGSLPHLSVDDLTRFFEFDDQLHSAQDAARSEQLQHEFQQKSQQQSTGAGVPASHPHFPGGFLGFSNEPMALQKLELLASKAVPFSRNSPHQMSTWWAKASTLTSRFFSLLHITSSSTGSFAFFFGGIATIFMHFDVQTRMHQHIQPIRYRAHIIPSRPLRPKCFC
jgi:alpha-1,3-mannosyl-glycoprotein beta-1,2-N-acetylglucosaminyltransferase